MSVKDAGWFPWHKKPLLMSEWEQIEEQALIFARLTTETHAKAKKTDMPFWFIEKVARNKYRARRRYWRLKRRVEKIKNQAMLNLLHAIGVASDD